MTEPESERDRCKLRHNDTAAKATLVESLLSRLLALRVSTLVLFIMAHIIIKIIVGLKG